jgi:hypothetical protein
MNPEQFLQRWTEGNINQKPKTLTAWLDQNSWACQHQVITGFPHPALPQSHIKHTSLNRLKDDHDMTKKMAAIAKVRWSTLPRSMEKYDPTANRITPKNAYVDTDAGIGGLDPMPKLCLSLVARRYVS